MIDWLRSHLVDDLAVIWKRWSVKLLAAQVIIGGTYAGLRAFDLAPSIPEWAKLSFFIVLSAAGLAAAPLKQKNLGE